VRPGDQAEDAILGFVRERFAPSVGRTRIDSDTPLFSTSLVDSFGVLELIAFVEQTFHVGIELSTHQIEDFDTVRKMAALVRRLPPT
jgi:acyl carrier protein